MSSTPSLHAPTPAAPCPPAAGRKPALHWLATEPARAALDALHALNPWRPRPATLPGQGHTVVLFPGLGTDTLALWPLQRHLQQAGYRPMDWGQGWNTGPQGDVDPWLDALADAMLARTASAESISLVGWSLGGLYARELAKRWPARVRQVITLGTPFNGSADDTHVGWLYRLLNGRHPPDEAALRARLAEPPPVPTASLYSRRDGVVAWQACTHARRHPQVQDIEVQASHLGMGWAPEVLTQVTALLGRPQETQA